ncbi:TPA: hypothetical protein JZG45_004015 [Escherichia coli]|nr:hypothetical protein [Escherichia coli]
MVDLNVLRQAAESEIAARVNGDTSDLWQDEASPEAVLEVLNCVADAKAQGAEAVLQLLQDELCGCRPGEVVGLAGAVTIAYNAAQDLRDGVEL